MIGAGTLGAYDNETNQMWINTEYLANSSTDECIQTLCHEVHHAYVNYLASSLDWDDPVLNTAYFKELREWVNNQKNYKSAWRYGFDAYENQPIEVAARSFAEEETALIKSYIGELRK